jgi:transcriptional regulator with XRE-family HTH domain
VASHNRGQNPQGRLTNWQRAQLDRLAGLNPESITKGLNMADPLSERVRRYVLETGGGLADVARATGLPKSTLNPWLKGERHITTSTFDRICEVYGVEPIRMSGDPSDDVLTAKQLGGLEESERVRLETELAEARQTIQKHQRVSFHVSEFIEAAKAANATVALENTPVPVGANLTEASFDIVRPQKKGAK